jgi:putative peptidoglycan lipid II flippase
VHAVRRHAGGAALAGLLRAAGAGIVAAVVAASAGWGVVTGLGSGGAPTVVGSGVQGILGGFAVGAVYVATAYLLDRPDVGQLGRRVRRTVGKGRS